MTLNLNKKSRIVKINTIERNQIELSKIIKISWITPQMLLLFHTNMREKRQFIDRLVNYLNPTHISCIYKFEKLVRERSKILMDFTYDELWVDSLEKNIVDLAILIIKNRNVLISEVNKINSKMKPVDDSYFPVVKLGLEGAAEELTNDVTKVFIGALAAIARSVTSLGGSARRIRLIPAIGLAQRKQVVGSCVGMRPDLH